MERRRSRRLARERPRSRAAGTPPGQPPGRRRSAAARRALGRAPDHDLKPLVVFVSSRTEELLRERELVQRTVEERFGGIVKGWRFEATPASSREIRDVYLDQVSRSSMVDERDALLTDCVKLLACCPANLEARLRYAHVLRAAGREGDARTMLTTGLPPHDALNSFADLLFMGDPNDELVVQTWLSPSFSLLTPAICPQTGGP